MENKRNNVTQKIFFFCDNFLNFFAGTYNYSSYFSLYLVLPLRRSKSMFGHCRYIFHVKIDVKPGAIYVDSDNMKSKWAIKNRKVGMCSPLSTLTLNAFLLTNSPLFLRSEDAIFVAFVLAIFSKQKSKLQKYFDSLICT